MARDECVCVVSGLPRSGTSMAMAMLGAGGMELFADGVRAADADNPAGYFEHELAKGIRTDNSWVARAIGKAVKIVSPSLRYLPDSLNYSVVFMRRDLGEIGRSQEQMLIRLGRATGGDGVAMAEAMRHHLLQVEEWLAQQVNMNILYLDYREVVERPSEACRRLVQFANLNGDPARMAAVVEARLYRQRAGSSRRIHEEGHGISKQDLHQDG